MVRDSLLIPAGAKSVHGVLLKTILAVLLGLTLLGLTLYLAVAHAGAGFALRGFALRTVDLADPGIPPASLLASNTSQYSQLIYQSHELVIHQHVGGSIDVRNADRLSSLQTTLHLYPLDDYRQVVVEQNFTPQPQFVSESDAMFKWSKPVDSSLEFSSDSLVRTRNVYMEITHVVPYPIAESDIPEDVVEYLRFTDLIDNDPRVAAKARELAMSTGSNDLFAVSFAVASWVSTNIQYDLTTITADATQNASWVFSQRKGVCDELSVLYISMMRSLGVPARFVSGISYTNSPLFSNPWNPHAWVEVYFPQYGWVPFDLTYKQFGYIDAGHIAMQTSVNANDSATEYAWQGYGIDQVRVTPSDLVFDTELVDARSQVENFVQPTVSLLRDTVSLSSSSALEIKLQNTKNYYVTAQLGIAAPPELIISSGKDISVLLRPFEEKTLYIPVLVAPGLSSRYSYQFPILVTNYYRSLANTTLYVDNSNPTYGADEIVRMIQNAQAASQSSVGATIHPQCAFSGGAGGLNLSAAASKVSANQAGTILVNQTASFKCDIANDGDVAYHDVLVCVNGACKSATLGAHDTTSFLYNITFDSVGIQEIPVRLQFANKVQETLVDVTVVDSPRISITALEVPARLRYAESAQVRVLLSKTSFTAPTHVVARIFDGIPYVWNVGTLNANKELTVTITGSQLKPGMNAVPVYVAFTDGSGKLSTYQANLSVELYDVTFLQRVAIWLRGLLA